MHRTAKSPHIHPVPHPEQTIRRGLRKNKKLIRRIIATSRRHETFVVIPDAHVPFHNVELIRKICQLIRDIHADGIVLAGDFLDLFSLSQYAADSVFQLKDVTLDGEYKAGNEVLDMLDEALGQGKQKHYLFGNHEDRYFRELQKGDRGKYGSALLSPTEALHLRERGYGVKENWKDDVVPLGAHLEITHGIFVNKHAAAKHLEEFQGSLIFGHTHRMQSYYLGKRAAFNIGTCCDINSKGFLYMPRPQRMKWSNGFGLVRIDAQGDYHTEVVQAYNNCFYANGRFY